MVFAQSEESLKHNTLRFGGRRGNPIQVDLDLYLSSVDYGKSLSGLCVLTSFSFLLNPE